MFLRLLHGRFLVSSISLSKDRALTRSPLSEVVVDKALIDGVVVIAEEAVDGAGVKSHRLRFLLAPEGAWSPTMGVVSALAAPIIGVSSHLVALTRDVLLYMVHTMRPKYL